MSALLHDKIAIITGAGAGIGEAIARAFSAEGARVVVSDIDLARAEKVAATLPGALAVGADVRDEAQVQALVERTVAEYGRLDVVVPNAGIATSLVVSEKAVAKHINSIFAKLDLPVGEDDHRRVRAVLTWLNL